MASTLRDFLSFFTACCFRLHFTIQLASIDECLNPLSPSAVWTVFASFPLRATSQQVNEQGSQGLSPICLGYLIVRDSLVKRHTKEPT